MPNFKQAIEKTRHLRAPDVQNVNRVALLNYYQNLFKLNQQGEIDKKETAYLIADTMFYEVVDKNQDLLEFTLDAGEQELPDKHISGDPNKRWQELNKEFERLVNQ